MRTQVLTVSGSLGSYAEDVPYEYLLQGFNYILQKQTAYEQAVAKGETVYSWEIPPEVILLNMNSSGGDVNQLYTACASLKNLNSIIPVIGLVTGKACSAAYMLLSNCSKIIALPGSTLGSIAGASSYLDYSGKLKEDGIIPYFYSTHSDKFSGLPGENKSPAEIENFLKNSADTYFKILSSMLEANRPGIGQEIKKLNGASFIVTGEEISPLYDLMASSFEEVYYTLENMNMKTDSFKSLFSFGGRGLPEDKAQVASVVSLAAEGRPTAVVSSAPAEPAVVLTVAEQAKAAALGEAMFQAFQAKVTASAEAARTTLIQGEPLKALASSGNIAAEMQEASLEELQAFANVHKASASVVLQVAQLKLPLEKAKQVMKTLMSSADASFSKAENTFSMSSLQDLASGEAGSSDALDPIFAAMAAGLKAK